MDASQDASQPRAARDPSCSTAVTPPPPRFFSFKALSLMARKSVSITPGSFSVNRSIVALLAAALAALLLSSLPSQTADGQGGSNTILVKNTDKAVGGGTQRAGHVGGSIFKVAQGFTTGTQGASLSEVRIRLQGVGDLADPQVSIYSSSSANAPNASLYVLVNPSSFTPDAVNTFTAPANSTLAANTRYHIVVETLATDADDDNLISLSLTDGDEDGEDDGGADRWSIANSSRYQTGASPWTSISQSLLIDLRGTLLQPTAPRLPPMTPLMPKPARR